MIEHYSVAMFCCMDDELANACREGNKELVLSMIEKAKLNGISKLNPIWDRALAYACRGGNKDIVELLIENGADDWNWGLSYACEYGKTELVQLMIEKGAQSAKGLHWNGGLAYSCYGGHLELAKLMIEKGATDWNWGLRNACVGGHIELLELMIFHSHGKANEWNWCLQISCRYGYIDIVELMIKKGAKKGVLGSEARLAEGLPSAESLNLCKGLIEVNETGRRDIAILLIENGADINACSIHLLDNEIYYLIQKGISCSSEYSHAVNEFGEYQTTLPIILNEILSRDLILEILIY